MCDDQFDRAHSRRAAVQRVIDQLLALYEEGMQIEREKPDPNPFAIELTAASMAQLRRSKEELNLKDAIGVERAFKTFSDLLENVASAKIDNFRQQVDVRFEAARERRA